MQIRAGASRTTRRAMNLAIVSARLQMYQMRPNGFKYDTSSVPPSTVSTAIVRISLPYGVSSWSYLWKHLSAAARDKPCERACGVAGKSGQSSLCRRFDISAARMAADVTSTPAQRNLLGPKGCVSSALTGWSSCVPTCCYRFIPSSPENVYRLPNIAATGKRN